MALPPPPKPPGKPGADAEDKAEAKPRVVEFAGMSNRAVRYRQLDALKVQKLEAEAAKAVGSEATIGELRNMQLLYGVWEMVYQVSDPTDDPAKLDPKTGWKAVNPVDFITPGNPFYGPKLFTPKDLGILKQEYRKYHEVPQMEYDLIAGKSISLLEDTEG